MSLINPFKLLGITSESTKSELKKAYYSLALLCHPDRGGNEKDMDILHSAYKYVLRQFNGINDATFEELEESFEEFLKQQEKIKPPSFYDIHNEIHRAKEFDKAFEKERQNTAFDSGYGELMDPSNHAFYDCIVEDALGEYKYDEEGNPIGEDTSPYSAVEPTPPKNAFVQDLVMYKEPEFLPNDYGNYHRFDKTEVKDFSGKVGKIDMTDYVKAHSTISEDKPVEEKLKDYYKNHEINVDSCIAKRELQDIEEYIDSCLCYVSDRDGSIYVPKDIDILTFGDVKEYITTKRKIHVGNIHLFNSKTREVFHDKDNINLKKMESKYIHMVVKPISI